MNGPYRRRGPAELAAGTFFLDLGKDHRDTTFVAGSGRSGTTWLSELINHDNQYRYIFEPFRPGKVALCGGFLRKQYLRPEDNHPTYLEAAGKILSGKVRSRWADRHNRKILARRRLVKDIRANLLLGWMRRHFPEMPTVLILRHPCAVASSRLRLGWQDNLDEVMSQKQLVEDHLKPFEDDILAAEDPFDRSIFLWCIENYVPLRQPEADGTHVVFYERLLAEPEEEFASLFGFLEARPNEGTPPRRDDPPGRLIPRRRIPPPGAITLERLYEGRGNTIRDASSESAASGESSGERRASEWRGRVGEARRRRAGEILGLFGMDRIYGEDPMPRPEGVFEIAEARR